VIPIKPLEKLLPVELFPAALVAPESCNGRFSLCLCCLDATGGIALDDVVRKLDRSLRNCRRVGAGMEMSRLKAGRNPAVDLVALVGISHGIECSRDVFSCSERCPLAHALNGFEDHVRVDQEVLDHAHRQQRHGPVRLGLDILI
jgi:hypothetical protein